MSYLLVQILICLLIAGLIGAIIGWLLRGGCDDKIQANDEAWNAKFLESETQWEDRMQASMSDYDSKLQDAEFEKKSLRANIDSTNSEWEGKMQTSMSDYDSKLQDAELEKESLAANLETANSDIKQAEQKLHGSVEDMDECYEVEEIEGIGPAYGKKLRKIGVNTTCDMVLAFLRDEDNVSKAAKEMKVDADALRAWASMADLMKLPGVGGQFAELMQTVGISSVEELSTVNATSLHSDMVQFNKKTPIVPQVPSLEALSSWVKVAKEI